VLLHPIPCLPGRSCCCCNACASSGAAAAALCAPAQTAVRRWAARLACASASSARASWLSATRPHRLCAECNLAMPIMHFGARGMLSTTTYHSDRLDLQREMPKAGHTIPRRRVTGRLPRSTRPPRSPRALSDCQAVGKVTARNCISCQRRDNMHVYIDASSHVVAICVISLIGRIRAVPSYNRPSAVSQHGHGHSTS
jgi:hypothetical protein